MSYLSTYARPLGFGDTCTDNPATPGCPPPRSPCGPYMAQRPDGSCVGMGVVTPEEGRCNHLGGSYKPMTVGDPGLPPRCVFADGHVCSYSQLMANTCAPLKQTGNQGMTLRAVWPYLAIVGGVGVLWFVMRKPKA